MRAIITVFSATMLVAAPCAWSQAAPASGDFVGQWTRPDGFQQTTLISHTGSLSFAVPGDWKAIRFDFKLPVAMAVFEVPDPSVLDGGSNTNCSMAFADPTTSDGKALIARVSGFGEGDAPRDGWVQRTRSETDAASVETVEKVAIKREGGITAVGICAWPKGASHDATYDAYMMRLFNTMLDSVQAPASPFKAHPGEQFFSAQ